MIATLNTSGKRIRLDLADPEDHISRRILRKRDWYERDLLTDLRSRVRRGGRAIDVGAHIGNHTLWMAGICGLRVTAFEPNPASRAQLERNVALNQLAGQVEILAAAAGAAAGRARVEVPNPANTGTAHCVVDAAGDVPVVPIDTLALDEVAVIKVDVEGAELDILEGARETITRCQPVLYVEAADEPARKRVAGFLEELGYACFGQFALTPTYGFAPRQIEVRLSAAIMAHPKRQRFVGELVGVLDGPPLIAWDRQNDRWDTGRRALLAHDPDATHHLVIQDDAIVCKDLLAGTARRIAEHPDAVVSLYLGRQRPHGPKFEKMMAEAVEKKLRWLSFSSLCWGVAIVVPTALIAEVVAWGDEHHSIANYDMRISRYLEREHIPIRYTVPSLVDHRPQASSPSLIPGRTGAHRVAHWFIGARQSALEEPRWPKPKSSSTTAGSANSSKAMSLRA